MGKGEAGGAKHLFPLRDLKCAAVFRIFRDHPCFSAARLNKYDLFCRNAQHLARVGVHKDNGAFVYSFYRAVQRSKKPLRFNRLFKITECFDIKSVVYTLGIFGGYDKDNARIPLFKFTRGLYSV